MNLPTYLNSEEPPSDEIMHVLIQNKAAHTLILERFPNSRLAIKLRGSLPSMENNLNPEQSKQQVPLLDKALCCIFHFVLLYFFPNECPGLC